VIPGSAADWKTHQKSLFWYTGLATLGREYPLSGSK